MIESHRFGGWSGSKEGQKAEGEARAVIADLMDAHMKLWYPNASSLYDPLAASLYGWVSKLVRMDAYVPINLERANLHNEMCAIRESPPNWK